MGNEKLLDKIAAAWAGLQASYAGLTAEQMQEPGAAGEWSVKDTLAHVTTWEQESLDHLPVIVRRGACPKLQQVLWGDRRVQRGRRWRASASSRWTKSCGSSKTRTGGWSSTSRLSPVEQFNSKSRGRRRLGWDSFKHYPHHEQAIREWRERQGY